MDISFCMAEVVRVGVYQNEPYVMIEEGGGARGICVEVLEEIARREDWRLEYIPGSWAQCLENLTGGEIDVLVAIAYGTLRERHFDFTQNTILVTWGRIYTKKGSGIKSMLDLDGKRVAVLKADIYATRIMTTVQRFNLNCEFVVKDDYRDVLKEVRDGGAQAGAVDRFLGAKHCADLGLDESPIVFSPIEVKYAFPAGQKADLIAVIDRHLGEMLQDKGSVLQRSKARWLGPAPPAQIAPWMIYLFIVLSSAVILFIISSYILKRRIKIKTLELSRERDKLENEIRERRETERLLRLSEGKYRLLFDSSPQAVIILDQGGRIREINKTAEEMTWICWKEGIGKKISSWNAFAGESGRIVKKIDKVNRGESVKPFEISIQLGRSGETRRLLIDLALLKDIRETQVIQMIALDVTEKVLLEEHLRKVQKMEAVGTLAGGIAHDFNNLLTGVLGYSNMLKLSYDPEHEVYKAADVIEEAAERASRLTNQLLGFARMGKNQNISMDVCRIVEEVISILECTLDKNIRITMKSAQGPLFVSGDPHQLQQVMVNLALNSRDAMPGGGEIVFETGPVELDGEDCRDHPDARPGTYMCLSVTDTGEGIPEEIKDRIFEPFFSSRKQGERSGMGLAMAYGTVKNHGGFISVESESGRGTRMNVYLPLSAVDPLAEGEEASSLPAEGTGTVMIVDDEDIVLKTSRSMLEKLGYEVRAFSQGREAVEYFKEHHQKVDLVVLDMIMPGMDGAECFREMKKIDPGITAILSTGYGLNDRAREIIGGGMAGFVQKPYLISNLAKAVAENIKGPAP
ncbi:MAG: transporter substrate-binding domain-containing protein [Candidatus Krumholzibacteriota bacterium]|nr:transporter substrate-binding domain-containing protein [Candidatus Krumholzibacteriota bacterium]